MSASSPFQSVFSLPMFGLPADHPFFTYTLPLALAGVVCTVATTAVVTWSISYVVREHNLTTLRRHFRRRLRTFQDALRSVDEELERMVKPGIERVRKFVEGEDGGKVLYRESSVLEAAIRKVRSQHRSGVEPSTPDGASHSPRPHDRHSNSHGNGAPSPRTKSRSSSLTKESSSPFGITSSAPSLPSTPRPKTKHRTSSTKSTSSVSSASSFTSSASAQFDPEKKLRELDEQLVRLLERLDALQPSSIIDDPVLADVLASTLRTPSEETSSQSPSSSTSKGDDASNSSESISLLLGFLPSWLTGAKSESASKGVQALRPPGMDAATCELVVKDMEQARVEKRAVVDRVQSLVREIDRVCEVAGIRSVGLQHA
ncbi:hypothetical protein BJ742DRAFT_800011, partial [Cladochytrium replicatum]